MILYLILKYYIPLCKRQLVFLEEFQQFIKTKIKIVVTLILYLACWELLYLIAFM